MFCAYICKIIFTKLVYFCILRLTTTNFKSKIEKDFQFRAVVKISGYNTKQKDAVLGILAARVNYSFSAKEVFTLCAKNGTPVGLATVYRQLERLCESKKVKKIPGEDGGFLFQFLAQPSQSCAQGFYLKCHKCGRLTPAECDLLINVATHMNEEHGFEIDANFSVLYGLCKGCK